MLMQSFTASEGMAYKIAAEGKTIGYIMEKPVSDPRMDSAVDIDSVAVMPEYRGKGIGKALMLWVEEEAKTRGYRLMVLKVREKNIPALSLYRKLDTSPSNVYPIITPMIMENHVMESE